MRIGENRRFRPAHPDHVVEGILADYSDPSCPPIKVIAQKWGVSQGYVSAKATRAGLRRNRRVSVWVKDEIRRLYFETEMIQREIAEKLGVSQSTVCAVTRRARQNRAA